MTEADSRSALADLRAAANTALVLQDYAAARRAYGELRGLLAAKFGEEQTPVALIDEILGGVERAAGDLGSARVAFERARSVFRAHGDPRAAWIDTIPRPPRSCRRGGARPPASRSDRS